MALVGLDGSIDWLGLPRFDSAACFSALLADPGYGRWLVAPGGQASRVTRRYRGDTMILETTFETDSGDVCVIDFMSRRDGVSDLVRIVRGLRGKVAMRSELIVRFEYGSVLPWVSRGRTAGVEIVAGPDRLLFDASIPLRGEDFRTVGEFEIAAGEEVDFLLSWSPSYRATPEPVRAADTLAQAEMFWSDWCALQVGRRMVGGRDSLVADIEGAIASRDRRYRSRRDHVVAGKNRWQPAIGTTATAGSATPRYAIRPA